MKILYITTLGITMSFFKEFVIELMNEGNQVDIACNESEFAVHPIFRERGCIIHQINFSRFPFAISNIFSTKKVKDLITNNKYDLIHCHTPVASACTRFACRKLRTIHGIRVFYTSHGFHFYKRASIVNWMLFYPIEWICAHWTDVLITINIEDFNFAKKHIPAKKVRYIPGVGVDILRFENNASDQLITRNQIEVNPKAFMLLSIGELNSNKNHETVIRALGQIEMNNFFYVIAGKGKLLQHLKSVAVSVGIEDRVIFLGYRNDIVELCNAADVYIHPSFREGLPVSVMEAMASGLPVVCSRIRGNKDLIDQRGGILFDPYSIKELKEALLVLTNCDLQEMGKYNKDKVKSYSIENVNKKIKELYITLSRENRNRHRP